MQEAVELAIRAVAPKIGCRTELAKMAIGLDKHRWSTPIVIDDECVGSVCEDCGRPIAWPRNLRPAG